MVHYPTLAYVTLFSSVLPLLIGVYKWKLVSRELKILVLYLTIGLTIDIVTMWFIANPRINLGLMHFYYLVEYIFIISIIVSWQESPKIKSLFQILLLCYVLFWFCAKFTFEPFNGLYSLTASVSYVLLALSAGYTLFIVIGNRVQSLFSRQQFWVLLSVVVYYTGTLALVALQGILVHYSTEDLFLAGSINWSLKILFNILFTVGFLCPQTQP